MPSTMEACCTDLVAGPLERIPLLLLHLCAHTSVECGGLLPTGLQCTICQARRSEKGNTHFSSTTKLTWMHSVVG